MLYVMLYCCKSSMKLGPFVSWGRAHFVPALFYFLGSWRFYRWIYWLG